jgi:hypothetical protein
MQTDVLKALAVTAELTGTELSEAAARVLAADLDGYDPQQLLGALKRVRMDGARLTVGNIVARLDDGRPGVEEAWAMMPHSEDGSVVMTQEMAYAFGVCAPLIADGDMVAARMAFKESYTAAVARSREAKSPPRWFPSLGADRHGREAALIEAVRKHRLSVDHAVSLLPPERHAVLLEAAGLPAPPSNPKQVQHVQKLLGGHHAN